MTVTIVEIMGGYGRVALNGSGQPITLGQSGPIHSSCYGPPSANFVYVSSAELESILANLELIHEDQLAAIDLRGDLVALAAENALILRQIRFGLSVARGEDLADVDPER